MRVLKLITFTIFIGCFIFSISCKPEGPLTPEQAFEQLRKAYYKRDAAAVINILSKGSLEKMGSIISKFRSMDEFQLKSLSARFGATVEEIKNLSAEDYMDIQFSTGEKLGDDALNEIIKYKIISVEKNKAGDRAVVKVENGMELVFVKEGGYWKFSMEDL